MLRRKISLASLMLALSAALPNRASAQATDQIPLVVVLWEHINFGGKKRTLVGDTPKLTRQNFNDIASSVAVHPGPNYRDWKLANPKREPTITLFVDEGGWARRDARAIVLRAGIYPNLHARGWGDRVSSVYFSGAAGAIAPLAPSGPAAPFNFIPFVTKLYTDANYDGYELTIVESTSNIRADFGGQFDNKFSSVSITKGPNYSGGRTVELCVDEYFDKCLVASSDNDFGSVFQEPTPLQDSISSVRIK